MPIFRLPRCHICSSTTSYYRQYILFDKIDKCYLCYPTCYIKFFKQYYSHIVKIPYDHSINGYYILDATIHISPPYLKDLCDPDVDPIFNVTLSYVDISDKDTRNKVRNDSIKYIGHMYQSQEFYFTPAGYIEGTDVSYIWKIKTETVESETVFIPVVLTTYDFVNLRATIDAIEESFCEV